MDKPNAKKKSVFKIVVDVIFGLIMVFVATLLTFSIIEKKTGKSVTGYRMIWILTESMEDTIPAQSYILCKDVDGSEVKQGDVITFISTDPVLDGGYNTHRVIGIGTNGEFITKGDNNPYQDEYTVPPENVISMYIKNMPLATFVGRFYAEPIGYAMTIVVVVLLVGAWFVLDQKSKKKQEKEELMQKMIAEEVKKLEEQAKNDKKD